MQRRHQDENGSVLLAMLAIIAIAGLVTATLGLVRQSQFTTRRDRNFTSAIQVADAAVQQAYTYFTTHAPAGDTITSTGLGLSSTTADGDFEWTATRDGFDWDIRAKGRVGDVDRYIEVKISRGADFLLAAFGDTLLDLNGSNLVQSYNSSTGAGNTGNGNVGSNGLINFKGNASSDAVFIYGGSASDGSRCTGNCPNVTGYSLADSFDVPAIHSAIAAEAAVVCASGAVDGLYQASVDGDLTPGGGGGVDGVYCFDEMRFDDDMDIIGNDQDNPAVAYVLTYGIVSNGNHMEINCPGCNSSAQTGFEPAGFRINVVNGNVGFANQSAYGFILTAPFAACNKSSGGGQTTVYGSLLCGSIDVKGGFDLYFDDNALESGTGQYSITDYREELASTSTID